MDAIEVGLDRRGAFPGVVRHQVAWKLTGVDDDCIDAPADILVDRAHEVGGREAVRLAMLRHHVADVHDLRIAGTNDLGHALDQQAGYNACEQVSRADQQLVRPFERLARPCRDPGAWLQKHALDREDGATVGVVDGRLTADDGAVAQFGTQGRVIERHRNDMASRIEYLFGVLERAKEVTVILVLQRVQDQVAEGVPANNAIW